MARRDGLAAALIGIFGAGCGSATAASPPLQHAPSPLPLATADAGSPPDRATPSATREGRSPSLSARPATGNPRAQPVFLGAIAVSGLDGDTIGPDDPLAVTLVPAGNGSAVRTEIARRTRATAAPHGAVRIVYGGYPTAHDRVLPRYREPSFVVDYDEPAVHVVRAEADAESPEHPPTVEWLARFVDHFIDKKDMQREFDVASRVASHHEGDCTEHAVLLAALARSFGHPARIVIGDVLLSVEGRYVGVGHAWVEYHRDSTWLPADAAIPPEAHPRYLPISVLEDEGPAFERVFFEAVGAADVARIELARAKP